MTKPAQTDGIEREWRRLCELVATESDPGRLSGLIDRLLKELDARKDALREIKE